MNTWKKLSLSYKQLLLLLAILIKCIDTREVNLLKLNSQRSGLINQNKWRVNNDGNRIFWSVCKCSGPKHFPMIVCSNVSNESVLRDALSAKFMIEEFGKFALTDSVDIKVINNFVIPADKRFKFISIRKTTLTSLPEDLLKYSCATLRRLEVIHNNIETFPFHNKLVFPQLQHVDLYYNSLAAIPDYAFANYVALKTLDLSFNRISYIGSYAFYKNDRLEYLDLRFNKLKVVNNYAFALKSSSLTLRIELTSNNMLYLSDGAFGEHSPAILNISVNSLTKFSEQIFMPILRDMGRQNKGIIVVNNNRFKCSCENIGWLVRLETEHKRRVKGFSCNDLKYKTLANLTLTDIGCDLSLII